MPALLIERGLYAATEDLVDRMPVPRRLELPTADRALPDPVVRIGYFVVAEALTNGVKHSKARELAVCLTRPADVLRIEVRDDGVGAHASGEARACAALPTAWTCSEADWSWTARPVKERG